MDNQNFSPFEEKIKIAVKMPQPHPEFIKKLRSRLLITPVQPESVNRPSPFSHVRRIWAGGLVLALLATGFLAIGPQQVYAAINGLMAYIPGAGIVDQNFPIRILAEPVTVTKDGVSITIDGAVLSRNKTHIVYSITGVPDSAYPEHNSINSCVKADYLRLPDGRQIGRLTKVYQPIPTNIDFQPVPEEINDVVYVIPCLINTLPGTVPENWEIPLHFVSGPPDMAMLPVKEVTVSSNEDTLLKDNVIVQKAIRTEDGYILIGITHPETGESFDADGPYEIRDAAGKKVEYEYPQDISLDYAPEGSQDIQWATQFKTTGLVYPLAISFPMTKVLHPDPQATASFEFDAGLNPQAGQDFTSGQKITLSGYTLKVTSIKADAFNGYTFTFQASPEVNSVEVKIEGHPLLALGSGKNADGTFDRMLRFEDRPTGKLMVIVSNLSINGGDVTFEGQWSPDR